MTYFSCSFIFSSKRRKLVESGEARRIYTDEELLALLAEENEEEEDIFSVDLVEELEEEEEEWQIASDVNSEVEEVIPDILHEPGTSAPSPVPVPQESSSPRNTPTNVRQWSREMPTTKPPFQPFALNPQLTVPLTDLKAPRDFANILLT
ncbi:hypothetical protein J437_LFUL017322 [Ladona fulva]|uniref:Uncharacterized protein n=1 Tax=Ladona fulva TaxID=123851 RepID=A0A8K0PBM7_LADFU|nr:hypothetical protein J437_LFUL017322 [Ladona fulva]